VRQLPADDGREIDKEPGGKVELESWQMKELIMKYHTTNSAISFIAYMVILIALVWVN